MKKIKNILICVILFLSFVLVGCGGGNSSSSNSSNPTKPNSSIPSDKVSSSVDKPEHVHNYYIKEEIITNCSEPVVIVYECKCGDSYSKTEIRDLDHNFSEWIVEKEPSEKEKGLQVRECRVCGHREEEEIDIVEHQHQYKKSGSVQPTCEEEGYTLFVCECGDKYKDNFVPVVEHDYGEWKVVPEPTLTSEGKATRKCSYNTKHIQTITLPVLNENDYAYDVYQDATCENEGYASYTYLSEEIQGLVFYVDLEKIEHVYGEWTIEKEPTFEEEGLIYRYCVYNELDREEQTLPALSFTNGFYTYNIISDATCQHEGYAEFYFEIGDFTFYVASQTPKSDHIFGNGEIEYISATCEEPAYFKSQCVCGEILLEETEEGPLGHSYTNNWEIIVYPDEYYEGYALNYCDHDNSHFVERTLPALISEVYTKEVISESTCSSTGIEKYTYKILGTPGTTISFEITTATKEHEYEKSVSYVDCVNPGYTKYECTCGEYYYENYVGALGHDMHFNAYQMPTCEQDGCIQYYLCSTCNEAFYDRDGNNKVPSDAFVIPAPGHSYGQWKIVSNPTTTQEGQIYHECSSCSGKEYKTLEKLNKNTYQYNVVYSNTCESEGLEVYTYTIDNQKFEFRVYLDPLGHDYSGWTIVEEPTLDKDGLLINVCDNDAGHNQTHVLPALNKQDYEYNVKKAATCEETGLAGYIYNIERVAFAFEAEIEALGHEYDSYEISTYPTKTTEGEAIKICQNDNTHIVIVTLPVLNSEDYIYEIVKVADCEVDGLETYSITIEEQQLIIEVVIPMTGHKATKTNVYDELNHWDQCECGTAYNVEEHIFVDGYCTTCGIHESIKLLTFGIANNSYYYVQSVSTEATYVEFPETYKGYELRYIRNGGLSGCNSLETVVIPQTLSFSNGYDYFKRSPNLKYVYFKGTLSDWCNMEMNGVQYVSEELHLYVIENDEYVEVVDLVIPEDVKEVKKLQFAYFTNIKTVLIPSTVEKINQYAFYKNTGIEELIIEEGLLEMGNYAFSSCTSLSFAQLPSTLKEIPTEAFMDCTNLEEVIIPEGVETISYRAFKNNAKLLDVELPQSLITIRSEAFYNCDSFVNLLVPENVVTIESQAFYSCGNLETIDVLNEDCVIGSSVFLDAYKITEMRIPANHSIRFSSVVSKDIQTLKTVIITSCEALPDYYFEYFYSIETVQLPSNLVSIGEYAFRKMTSLTEVNIPYGTRTIGMYCFSGTNVLESISLPGTVTEIGMYCFENCTSLKTLSLGSSLTAIPDGAFYNCSSLTSIIIPDSVKTIGFESFYSCKSLKSAAISATSQLTTIGRYAFDECKVLRQIYLPATLTTIETRAFYGCEMLSEIQFATGCRLQSIEDYTFYNCKSLENINLENCTSLETIGENAFYYSGAIKNLTIPANVKTIKNNAFYLFNGTLTFAQNSKLETIDQRAFYSVTKDGFTLPSTLKVINNSAFYSLKVNYLVLPEGIKSVYNAAFGYARKVQLPSTIEYIGNSAFAGYDSYAQVDIYYLGNQEQFLTIGYEQGYSCTPFSLNTHIYVDGKKLSGDIVIDNMTVIPGGLFANSYITSVTILSDITRIESYAFYNCKNLESINLEDLENLDSISQYVFEKCKSLESIYLPNTLTFLGDCSFKDCTNLSEVIFEDNTNLTTINRSGIFDGCHSLRSLVLPEGLESMTYLSGGDNLMSVTFPSTMTSFPSSLRPTIVEVINLSSVELPSNYTTVINEYKQKTETSLEIDENELVFLKTLEGEYVLVNYLGNETVLILPNTYNGKEYEVSPNFLYQDYAVQVLVVPERVSFDIYDFNMSNLKDIAYSVDTAEYKVIDDFLVYNRTAVKYVGTSSEVVMPETINDETYNINFQIFERNKNITSVHISSGVIGNTSISFENCENLVTVTIDEEAQIYLGSFKNCYSLKNVPSTHYSSSYNLSALFENCYSLEAITITSEITSLQSNMFKNCYNLTSVRLPSTIKTIGSTAFYNCYSLMGIVLPSSLTSLGSSAFSGCVSLQQIQLPENLTYLGSSAFYNCLSLRTITIPATLKTIDYSTFEKSGLESAVFAENSQLTTIGQSAFRDCVGLTIVDLPEGVESIGSSAFKKCTSLELISIPASVTTIGSEAFAECYVLRSVGSLENVTVIESKTFMDCYNLTTIELSDELTSIRSKAFFNNFSLQSINLSKELTTIESEAFSSCYSLESIELSNKLTSIGDFAFAYCKKLKEVSIPDSVSSLGTGTFQNSGVKKATFGKDSAMTQFKNQAIDAGLTELFIPTSVTSIGAYIVRGVSNTTVYYYGTSEEWSLITINKSSGLANATIYFYSETEPQEEGNFWHLDTDGTTPVIW